MTNSGVVDWLRADYSKEVVAPAWKALPLASKVILLLEKYFDLLEKQKDEQGDR